MGNRSTELDQSFIDRQRARLESLRDDLIAAATSRSDEDAAIAVDAAGDAGEYEDDAQKLTILELDSNLVAHDERRLAQVERALKKIEDGTYGLSDLSGDAIPRERLDVMPEALHTVAEQESREN